MTLAIGTDILEIQRLSNVFERQGQKLVSRILTPTEQARFDGILDDATQLAFLAKRWSAKEAIAKALGTGIAKGVGWQQMEVLNDEHGAPVVTLSGAALERLEVLGAKKVLISLSDERHYCVAFCTLV